MNETGWIYGWAENNIDGETGAIDWVEACPYQMKYDHEGRATEIAFMGGRPKLLSKKTWIDATFDLVEPWDVWKCKAKDPNGSGCWILADIWQASEVGGPWKWATDKKGETMTAFVDKVKKNRDHRTKEKFGDYTADEKTHTKMISEKKLDKLKKASAKAADSKKKEKVWKMK